MTEPVSTSNTLLRGRVLTFLREPLGPDDRGAYRYLEDGALLIQGDRITAVDTYATLRAEAGARCTEHDHRPHLITAGFIDPHLHFPQTQVIASWGAELLDWLNTYTFPAEGRYADKGHAKTMAAAFLDLLLDHGTTSAAVFGSVHLAAADALFAEAGARRLRLIAGKTMMDRNAPAAVLDTAERGGADTQALIERWHGKDRLHVAITPRFAITSTADQLAAAGELRVAFPDCYVQTHLAENHAEIALTRDLYPEEVDYLGVYERFGLLGPKSLFGHCIHLSERERTVMAETGSVAVFCPTSNLFLGSGLFDDRGLAAAGVRRAIATDIGGGTSYSMLRTLDEGYKVLRLQHQALDPYRAFYWITRGNAEALSLVERVGTLEPGTDADIVVLNSAATSAMAHRMATVDQLGEELFVLQTLGDDRVIEAVYVAGARVRQRDPNTRGHA